MNTLKPSNHEQPQKPQNNFHSTQLHNTPPKNQQGTEGLNPPPTHIPSLQSLEKNYSKSLTHT